MPSPFSDLWKCGATISIIAAGVTHNQMIVGSLFIRHNYKQLNKFPVGLDKSSKSAIDYHISSTSIQ